MTTPRRYGLSKAVWNTEIMKSYINQKYGVGGWPGDSYRCRKKAWCDEMVEAALRAQGLEDYGVACWLTSGTARHLADQIPTGDTRIEKAGFAKEVEKACRDAFLKVVIWNHPDHRGNLASTMTLTSRLRDALKAEEA